MARRSEPPAPGGLSVLVHARISEDARRALLKRAEGEGIKPATWVRVTLMKALGLLGKP